MTMILTGKDCENCKYISESENKNKIYCAYHQKEYYYGQCIPCEDKKEVTENE